MMQLFGALILFITLSGACGLRCYTCLNADPKSCTDTTSCAFTSNRCYSLQVGGYDVVTKGCQTSALCVGPMSCCEGDLCNDSTPTSRDSKEPGHQSTLRDTAGRLCSVVLLLVSSAIIALFL